MPTALGILLPIERGSNGYFNQGFDTLEQVKSNFVNLIMTRIGERVHQPDFGCGIHDFLFEQKIEETMELARLSVIDAVAKWMPFLELLEVTVDEVVSNINTNNLQLYAKYRLSNAPNLTDEIIITF
jgi:phage baseplate assembly protein W